MFEIRKGKGSTNMRWNKRGSCWALGSVLPTSFMTWVNPLSWILSLAIVAEIKACGLWSNENLSPTIGIIASPSRKQFNHFKVDHGFHI
jgi:hypothetical protein